MKRETPHIDPWKTAGLYATQTHYFIHADICFIAAAIYPLGAAHILPAKAPMDELGAALTDAWSKGKFITPDDPEFDEVFGEGNDGSYEAMFDDFAARSGYISGNALLRRKPKFVSASHRNDGIRISPSRWIGRTAHEFMKDVPNVRLPRDADAEAIGEGIVEAFTRCR